ncbi:hypothetical protein ACFQZQ_03170 [Lysobacter koreensis]|uniref:Tetrapyrrole biosynthesis glutamyl-tRNA reductase dimerisation domain-containing protein n=1 Tax=Lysobacter koreensis TaxID=266122 RepID=A0ABW2YN86_9GAMM
MTTPTAPERAPMAADEVLRVMETASRRLRLERWPQNADEIEQASTAVAALVAERDALRGRVTFLEAYTEQLAGEKFSDRNHTALQSRTKAAESALADALPDALRYRVLREQDVRFNLSPKFTLDRLDVVIDNLLANKERTNGNDE